MLKHIFKTFRPTKRAEYIISIYKRTVIQWDSLTCPCTRTACRMYTVLNTKHAELDHTKIQSVHKMLDTY